MTEAPVKYGRLHLYSHDVAGWRRERSCEYPEGYPISLRPDWVCEILSSNFRDDRVRKQKVLHEWEVPFYWLVDPGFREIRILEWHDEDYKIVKDVDVDFRGALPPFDAVPISVKALFGLDDDNDEDAP